MSTSGELIEALASAGTVDSRGEFTLDRDKARDKLRRFQLADPHRYVLMLVEAAIARGANRLDFRIDADDVELRFSAEPFDEATLRNVYDALLVDRAAAGAGDADGFASRQLALGLNAAMGLDPKFVIVEGGPWRLVQRPGVADVVEALDPPAHEVRVHVKDRLRWRVLANWLRDRRDRVPEELRVREACAHTRVPVVVNGERISSGFPEHVGLFDVGFEVPEARGRIGVAPDHQPWDALALYNRGVRVCEQRVTGGPGGFVALVDGRRFARDVSQNDVQRDDEFAAAMAALETARLDVLGRFGASLVADGERARQGEHVTPEAAPRWTEELRTGFVRDWIIELIHGGRRDDDADRTDGADASSDERAADERSEDDETRARRRALFDPEHPAHALTRVPLWPTVDGERVDSQTLYEDGKRPVRFVHRDFEGYFPEHAGRTVMALRGGAELEAVFGRRVRDATRTFERERERAGNRIRWESSRRDATLEDDAWLARVALPEPLRGEVGVSSHRAGLVTVLLDGGVIHRFKPVFPLTTVHAVVEGEFKPLKAWDGVHRDAAYAAAIRALFEAFMEAATRAVLDHPERHSLRWVAPALLELVDDESAAAAFLAAAGFSTKAARRRGRAVQWPELDPSGASPHPLVDVPLVPFVDDPTLRSLRQIDAAARGGPIDVVDVQGTDAVRAGPAPGPVVHATPRERRWLERAFGDRVRDGRAALSKWRARQRFAAHAPGFSPRLHFVGVDHVCELELSDRRVWAGVLGVEAVGWWSGDRSGEVLVTLEGRALASLPLAPVMIPGVRLVVEAEERWADDAFEGLTREACAELDAIVREACTAFVRRLFTSDATWSPVLAGIGRAWVADWGLAVLDREPRIGREVRLHGIGGSQVTLAEVSRGLREHGYVAVAADDVTFAPEDTAEVPVPVIAANSPSHALLEPLEAVLIRDVTDTLRAALARRRLRAREPADEIRVSLDDAIVRVPVAATPDHPFVGEVVLPPPWTREHARLEAFSERRRVEAVELRAGLPWVAALDGPFTLVGTRDVAEDEHVRAAVSAVRVAIGEHAGAIVDALESGLDDAAAADPDVVERRPAATWWLLRVLGDARFEVDAATRGRAFALPLVRTIGGEPLSLDALGDAESPLEFVPPEVPVAGDVDPVVVLDGADASLVGRLVDRSVIDVSARVRAWRRARTLMGVTALIPTPHPPDDAFVSVREAGEGWTLDVWIRADGGGRFGADGIVAVGWRGSLVGRLPTPHPMRATGVLDVGWTHVHPDGSRLASPEELESAVAEAILTLYDQFAGALIERRDGPGRSALADHPVLLEHARWFASQAQRVRPPGVDGARWEALRRRWRDAIPLFENARGDRVTLAERMREVRAAREATRRGVRAAVPSVAPPPTEPVTGTLDATSPAPEPDPELSTLDDVQMDYPPLDPDADEPTPKVPASEIMRRAVVAELEAVTSGRAGVLTEERLACVTVVEGDGKRPVRVGRGVVEIDAAHPLGIAATGVDADACAISLLASAVFSGINALHDAVDEAHETAFCVQHTAWLAERDPDAS